MPRPARKRTQAEEAPVKVSSSPRKQAKTAPKIEPDAKKPKSAPGVFQVQADVPELKRKQTFFKCVQGLRCLRNSFLDKGKINAGSKIISWAIVNDKVFSVIADTKDFNNDVVTDKLFSKVFEFYQPGFNIDDDVSRNNVALNMASWNVSPGSILNLACKDAIVYRRCQVTQEDLESNLTFGKFNTMCKLSVTFNGEQVVPEGEGDEFIAQATNQKSFAICKQMADSVILKMPAAREAYKQYMFANFFTEEEQASLKNEGGDKSLNVWEAIQSGSTDNAKIAKFEKGHIASKVGTIAKWANKHLEINFTDKMVEKKKFYCCEGKLMTFRSKAMAESKQEAKNTCLGAIYNQFLSKHGDILAFKQSLKE